MTLMMNHVVRSRRGASPPIPFSADFSYAQFEGGLAGILDKSRSGTRTYWGAGGRTVWAGEITGTEAFITVVRSSGILETNEIVVSIDGGSDVNAPLVDGRFRLFTGLADVVHKVIIKSGAAYGSSIGVLNSGTVLSVTGVAPALVTASQQLTMHDGNALTLSRSAKTALVAPYTTYLPTVVPAGNTRYSTGQRFRTNATRLIVSSGARYIYLSTDGAAPVRYDRGITPAANCHIITLDGQVHTYNVWSKDGVIQATVGLLSVGINGTLYDIGTKKSLDQFGDSITEGVGSTSVGEVDVHGVAAHFGMLGASYGWAGEAIAGLKARLPSLLTNITPAIGDRALLAIGRNNVGAGWTAQAETDYLDCINQIKAVYGKVLCRGILPAGASTWSTENAAIANIVSTLADPNVVYIDVSTWTDIQYADGTHPNDTGYDTIETYAKTAYAPHL